MRHASHGASRPRTILWTILLAAALLWPGRALSALDGMPLDRAAEAILSAGLMPLLSRQARNAVRLMRFQSIASPAQALSGPWS